MDSPIVKLAKTISAEEVRESWKKVSVVDKILNIQPMPEPKGVFYWNNKGEMIFTNPCDEKPVGFAFTTKITKNKKFGQRYIDTKPRQIRKYIKALFGV